jgi:hypothetical protein
MFCGDQPGFSLMVDLTQFNTMSEPDFCPCFYTVLLLSLEKTKTGWITGPKNKWFIDGTGCKKDLS